MIIDYTIINERFEAGGVHIRLDDLVKEMLAAGWSLYGYPFSSEDMLHQAMVKYD